MDWRLGASCLEEDLAEEEDCSPRLAQFAAQIGVRHSDLSFLESLPPGLQENICDTFDSSWKKDGSILARLEAYARSVAQQAPSSQDQALPKRWEDCHAGIDGRVRSFVQALDLGEAALLLLQSLEEDLQDEIIEQFDAQGTRDGNVRIRFLSFLRALWARRLGLGPEVKDFLRDLPEETQVEVIRDFGPRGDKDGDLSAQLYIFALQRWRGISATEAFVSHWGLDDSALKVLESLPEELREEVLQGFDGSSTRDGHVTGRFLGYVRWRWAQHYELESDCVYALKRLPEDWQVLCLTTFDPSTTRDGNVSARFRSFLWKIEAQVAEDAGWYDDSSGYHSGYHSSYHSNYHPNSDSNYHSNYHPSSDSNYRSNYYPNYDSKYHSSRHSSYHSNYDSKPSSTYYSKPSSNYDSNYDHNYHAKHSSNNYSCDGLSHGHDDGRPRGDRATRDAILRFVARWDLDLAVGAYLETLSDPDLRARVLEEFDPSGTQDGNVLGRLKAFVRLLSSRKHDEETLEPAKRGVRARGKWQKKQPNTEEEEEEEGVAGRFLH